MVIVYCLHVSMTEFYMRRVNGTGFVSYVDGLAPSCIFMLFYLGHCDRILSPKGPLNPAIIYFRDAYQFRF